MTKSDWYFLIGGAGAVIAFVAMSKLSPAWLIFGIGPAVIGSAVLIAAAQGTPVPYVRCLAALVLSVPFYLLALAAFAWTASALQSFLTPSPLISDLGAGVVIGLFFAVLIAGLLVQLLALLIKGKWDMRSLLYLWMCGNGALVMTIVSRYAYFRVAGPPPDSVQLWLFFGPLCVIGGSLTTMLLGRQLRSPSS